MRRILEHLYAALILISQPLGLCHLAYVVCITNYTPNARDTGHQALGPVSCGNDTNSTILCPRKASVTIQAYGMIVTAH